MSTILRDQPQDASTEEGSLLSHLFKARNLDLRDIYLPTKVSNNITHHSRRVNGQRRRTHDGPRVKPTGPPGPEKSRQTPTKNIFSQIRLASWNIRTLSDTNTNRHAPERLSTLVAKELKRLNIDIAGLGEYRIPSIGEFTDGDYTFLHSGLQEDQPKLEGVAIVIKSSLRSCVIGWVGLSSRVMTARLALTKKCHATVISVYAPTFKRPTEEKNQFYELLA